MYKLLIAASLSVTLSSCGFGQSDATLDAPVATTQTTVTATTQQVTTTTEIYAPESGLEDTIVPDPSSIDLTDPIAVAQVVGCGYRARPTRSTTSEDIAISLGDLVTPELSSAIAEINQSGNEIIEVTPGAVVEIRYQRYEVNCDLTLISVGGQRDTLGTSLELRVVEQEDGTHKVSEITLLGRTIPEGLT